MNLLDLFVKVGIDDQATDKISGITEGAIARASAMGNAMYDIAKGVAGAAVDGIKAIGQGAVEGFAAYEQLTGGVAKLYGNAGQSIEQFAESAGKSVDEVSEAYQRNERAEALMAKNAEDAWRTVQMSANDYMETATSFSAALVSSLGGDTEKAAQQTQRAMQAISDNYNTFGSDIESVKNAFQGFAKQNYTMLDNLSIAGGMAA